MAGRRLLLSTLLGVLLTAALVGCTSKSSAPRAARSKAPSIAADVQVIRIDTDDALHFQPSSVTVKPGRVRLIFTVAGRMPHTFSSPALNVDSGNVQPGQSKTLDLNVPTPGTYPFACAYHRSQGMTGTIIASS
jgi:plastocyanin